MRKFAIYKYDFTEDIDKPPLFALEPPACGPVPPEQRQGCMLALFGKEGEAFGLKDTKKKDVCYPYTVMMNQDGIVMLQLERPKRIEVWKKRTTRPGELPRIDPEKVPSNPYCFVFIDCRKGHNKLAIEISSSAWRKTDEVKVLLAVNINMLFNSDPQYGFNVRIEPETYSFDYLEHQRFLRSKQKLTVETMKIHLQRGIIDPKVEAIVRHDRTIKSLFNSIFSSKRADISLKNPDVSGLIRKGSRLGEYFMMLVGSEQDEAFGVSLTLSNHRTYVWGEDIRIDFPMTDATLDSALGKDSLFPMPEVDKWFDRVENDIEEERNATNTQRRRTKEGA